MGKRNRKAPAWTDEQIRAMTDEQIDVLVDGSDYAVFDTADRERGERIARRMEKIEASDLDALIEKRQALDKLRRSLSASYTKLGKQLNVDPADVETIVVDRARRRKASRAPGQVVELSPGS